VYIRGVLANYSFSNGTIKGRAFKDHEVFMVATDTFNFKSPKIFVITRNPFTLLAVCNDDDDARCSLDIHSIINLHYWQPVS
jgi:hypothetical protein